MPLAPPADIATQISRDLYPRRRAEVIRIAAHAVRLDADKIGWLPYQFYDAEDAAGRLVSVTRNGEIVGFCAWAKPDIWQRSRIVQTWVREDARQIEHGRALLGRVARDAAAAGAVHLTCWVAEDLAAMRFWPAIGFTRVARRLGRGDLVDLRGRRMLTQFYRPCRSAGVEYQPCPKMLAPPSSCSNSGVNSLTCVSS